MENRQNILMNSNTNYGGANAASDNETTAAKLAVFGGLLSTIGDALSTMAAVLALEELQQEADSTNDRISELEKQIRYLTKEINENKNSRGY